jgi:hypothetical protein
MCCIGQYNVLQPPNMGIGGVPHSLDTMEWCVVSPTAAAALLCCSWASKQRRDLASGLLAAPKAELLQELSFEADEQEAEWLRWFLALAR